MDATRTRKCGIVMAGGSGTRLHPLTLTTSKHLLPVYDRPMIDYPLDTLCEAGVEDLLVITAPEHAEAYRQHLGDGTDRGLGIRYQVQPRPAGIAEVFTLADWFIGPDEFFLILGDNVFLPSGCLSLADLSRPTGGAVAFACLAEDVSPFGVVRFDAAGRVVALEEKPPAGGAGWVIPGLYLFGPEAVDLAAHLRPSARGELEVIHMLDLYLQQDRLAVHQLTHPELVWRDVGTFDALLEVANHAAAMAGSKVAVATAGPHQHRRPDFARSRT